MKFERAQDVEEMLSDIISKLEFFHVIDSRIICIRSIGSKANAYARIWSLPAIWRFALDINPFYIIEVISENYDKLSQKEKIKTLIHELMHIPRKFSGGLVPHKCGNKVINDRTVEKFYKEYVEKG